MDREGGNRQRMRKSWEWISLHFLSLSPFSLHFLILSLFPRSPAARLPQFVQPWLLAWISWYHLSQVIQIIDIYVFGGWGWGRDLMQSWQIRRQVANLVCTVPLTWCFGHIIITTIIIIIIIILNESFSTSLRTSPTCQERYIPLTEWCCLCTQDWD